MYCIFIDNKVKRIEKKLPDNFVSRTKEQLASQNIYEFVIDSSAASPFNRFTHYEDTLNGFVVTRTYHYEEKPIDDIKSLMESNIKEKLYDKILSKYDLQEQLLILSGVLGDNKKQKLINYYNQQLADFNKAKDSLSSSKVKKDYENLLKDKFFN